MKVFRGERGSMLLLAAIVLPVLLAFAALALDAGYFFDYKQRMGAAADAAAIAGAFEIKRNFTISQSNLETYARDDAGRNGFTDGTNGVTVAVTRPPSTGTHTSDSNYVQVVISRPTPTFFAKIFGYSTVPLSARAVATISDEGAGCVFALNTADTKYPIEFDINKSGTHISVPHCAIVTNGNLNVVSGSSIDSAVEILVGAASRTGTGTINPAPTFSVPPTPDPFADVNEASLFGTSWTCGWSGTKTPTGGGTTTAINGTGSALLTTSGFNYSMNPGVYCGVKGAVGIKIGAKIATPDPPGTCNAAVDDIVNFQPGIYIVVGGGLDWKHTCVTGAGVVFYLTGTSANPYVACGGNMLSTDAPDRFFMSAPLSTTVGFKKWDGTATSPTPYEGLLFMQDRRQGSGASGAFPSVNCVANPVIADMLPQNMILDGSLYFPNQHIKYGATSLSGGTYTILIGGTLEFLGAATFNSNFTGLANGSPIKSAGLGE